VDEFSWIVRGSLEFLVDLRELERRNEEEEQRKPGRRRSEGVEVQLTCLTVVRAEYSRME